MNNAEQRLWNSVEVTKLLVSAKSQRPATTPSSWAFDGDKTSIWIPAPEHTVELT